MTALLDGELDERLSADLEAHLAACEACRTERASLERIRHAMDSMDEGTRLGF